MRVEKVSTNHSRMIFGSNCQLQMEKRRGEVHVPSVIDNPFERTCIAIASAFRRIDAAGNTNPRSDCSKLEGDVGPVLYVTEMS